MNENNILASYLNLDKDKILVKLCKFNIKKEGYAEFKKESKDE